MWIPPVNQLGRIALVPFLWLAGAWLTPSAQAAWLPDGVPLCTETHPQQAPSIVYDGANGAIVAWADDRGFDIYAQRVDSLGVARWSANGVSVCSAGSAQFRPTAMPGPGGGAVIFWQDRRNGNDDIYAQRIDGNGVALWTFNGIPLGATPQDETGPLAIGDGAGGALNLPGYIVLWTYDEGLSGDQELRVQHVDSQGGGLWTPAPLGGVRLASVLGSQLLAPAMVTDGVGGVLAPKGAVVAWAQSGVIPPTGRDVYARRVNAAGTPQWMSGGVAVCALTGDQESPSIAYVGGGNVIIAWEDARTGDRDIYAQKLDSSGSPQWLANGLPICRASGAQYRPKLTPDGAGGVFAVWQDGRSAGAVQKIYAQRLDGSGQPLWGVDGIPLCSAPGGQFNHAVVTDGSGGLIVAWQDRRSSSYDDLYAQRVNPSGNLLWPSEGVPLTRAAGTQDYAALTSDGRSGALAAWRDDRAGNPDIYANRAAAGGGVVDVAGSGAPRLGLAFVSANPTRGEVRMKLELPEAAPMTADVLDALGRRVRSLCPGSDLASGTHLITWDGANESGVPTAAGVYFVRVRAGAATLTTRVVQLR